MLLHLICYTTSDLLPVANWQRWQTIRFVFLIWENDAMDNFFIYFFPSLLFLSKPNLNSIVKKILHLAHFPPLLVESRSRPWTLLKDFLKLFARARQTHAASRGRERARERSRISVSHVLKWVQRRRRWKRGRRTLRHPENHISGNHSASSVYANCIHEDLFTQRQSPAHLVGDERLTQPRDQPAECH